MTTYTVPPYGTEEFVTYREALRERLLTDIMLGLFDDLIPNAYFCGGGDSGEVYTETSDDELNFFFERLVTERIEWDWYNGDGGGGDINWDLKEDELVITGYQNYTEHVDQPEVTV